MIKIVITAVSALLVILLIGAYLSPDDLARCESEPTTITGCEKADAIVAVSGGDTQARTHEAVALYKQGWADTLIFSGAAADKSGPSNASAMRDHAIEMGVPDGAIIIEELSETTQQNAVLSSDVLSENSYHRVILVTSAYHQRRAGLVFQQSVGSDVELVNHPVETDNQWSKVWWLTFTGWRLAISELVKIVLVYAGVSR